MSIPSGRHPSRYLAAPADQAVAVWLRRLKVIAIVLPVLLVVAVEMTEVVAVERLRLDGGHLALACAAALAAVAFAVGMFFFVDHAYRLILRQNRELAMLNAISTAVNGDLDVEQIVGTALDSVLAWSGASEASVTAAVGGTPAEEDVETWHRAAAGAPDAAGSPPHVVDIPLLAGTSAVGTLRLHLPAGMPRSQRPRPETLRTIGQQLGSAIRRAQLFGDLQRRKREGHALYALLLRISGQSSPVATLAFMVGLARDLLDADEAGLCLRQAASWTAPADGLPPDPSTLDSCDGCPPAPHPDSAAAARGPLCVVAEGALPCATHQALCPLLGPARHPAMVSVPVRGGGEQMGEIWLGRRSEVPFRPRDEDFLATLAELAVVALAHARMLENERHGAMLAERERIAREMHDSLAQVLGVTHLRLHALATRPEVAGAAEVAGELEDLVDICQEAYRDVREAILGLHESSRTDRALLESLRAYVHKYSQQSGVQTTLDSAVDHDLTLPPRCEVQVIRVIQEALTNVRKHSGARTAAVRVAQTPDATTFVVEDDGHGFDPAAVPTERDGFGLQSMRERMRLVNGSLTIDSAPGRGTRVIVGIPTPDRAPHPSFEAVEV